jgi:hypothetical protein
VNDPAVVDEETRHSDDDNDPAADYHDDHDYNDHDRYHNCHQH